MSGAAALEPDAGGPATLRLRPDERLARKAAAGDRGAIEAIYQRYHQDLYRFCAAMVGNPQDAQDALQNTMVKVLRALPGEERRIQLKPWLYRIARNEAVEVLRRRRESTELGEELPAPGGEIAETAEARERLRDLIDDLDQLPHRQRAVLVMRELGGLGFEEIAAAFDTSASAARQTLYEARLSLRQMETGREMDCDGVMRELSDADGRVARRRELRAHLRGCPDCREFAASIGRRRDELAAIAPLPVAASAALLHGALAGSAGGAATSGAAGGGLAGTIGVGAGKAAAGSAIAKTIATVAVVATVGVTAADRGGLIQVPLTPGGSDRDGPLRTAPPDVPGAAGLKEAHAPQAEDSQTHTSTPEKPQGAEEGRGTSHPAAAPRGSDAPGNSGSHSRAAAHRNSAANHTKSSSQGQHEADRHTSGPSSSADRGQETAGAHKSPHGNLAPATGPRESPPKSASREKPALPPAKPEHSVEAPETAVEPESSRGEGHPSPPAGATEKQVTPAL
jgi:RNA polymerase sigma factor (sigma-70 family)